MAQSSFRTIAQPQGQRPLVEIRSPLARPLDITSPENGFEAGVGLRQQALAEREDRRRQNIQTPSPADPWKDMRQETMTFGGRLRSLFGGGQ